MKNLINNIAVLVFFIILSLFYTYPAINHFSTHIIGDGGDGLENYANMIAVSKRITGGELPFGTTTIYRYPFGVHSALHENKIMSLVGGSLSVFINSTVAYNMYVICVIALNGYVSYLFYRSLTGHGFASLIGGVLNGFTFYNLSNANGTIGYLYVFWYPVLSLLHLNVFRRVIKTIHYYIYALILFFILMSGMTPFFLIISTATIAYGIGAIFLEERIKNMASFCRGHTVHIFAVILLLVILFVIIQLPAIGIFSRQTYVNNSFLFTRQGAPLTTFIIPPVNYYHSLPGVLLRDFGFKFPYGEEWHDSLYIGIPTFLLLFISFVGILKKGGSYFWHTATAVLLFVVVSPLLYTPTVVAGLLGKLLLPLKFITDYYYMFLTPFWFFAAAAIVYGLTKIKPGKAILLAMIALLIFERGNVGFSTLDVSLYDGGNYTKVVKDLSGSAVFDVPVDVYTEYNLLPNAYEKPIVGGMVHWTADTPERRFLIDSPALARFSCTGESFMSAQPVRVDISNQQDMDLLNRMTLETLLSYDIRTIVVHRGRYDGDSCIRVREHLRSFELFLDNIVMPGKNQSQYSLTLKHEDERTFVYQLESVDIK